MKIFLDTANMEEIIKYNKMGLLDGITTNPTLLSKETGMNPQEVMKDIAKLIKGDVSLEVIGLKSDEMIQEGKKLREYGENVVVKCPMTGEGLRACAELTSQGIPVNITLVFSANQALLAAKAGAKYVSPFIGRLDDIGQDGMQLTLHTRYQIDILKLQRKNADTCCKYKTSSTRTRGCKDWS